jgi:hypothetical protein
VSDNFRRFVLDQRRFEETRERDEAQDELLTQVLHHVRGRVENLERGRNRL